jgi:hypothetical protein
MRGRFLRVLLAGIILSGISAFEYSHLNNNDTVDTIHMINLLVCGAGIGMFVVSVAGLFIWKNKSEKKDDMR